MSEGYSSRLAWGAGAFAEIKFTETFSLQAGLEYSGQGGKKNGNQAMPSSKYLAGFTGGIETGFAGMVSNVAQVSPTGAAQLTAFGQAMNTAFAGMAGQMPKYLYADYESVTRFDYLMLPVQAKFGWNFSQTSPWRVYVQAGLFVSYLFNAEREMSGSSMVFTDKAHTATLGQAFQNNVLPALSGAAAGVTDPVAAQALGNFLSGITSTLGLPTNFGGTQDIYDDLHKFNFGFIGAAGVSYTFNRRHSVFLEGGGNYGFIKLQKNAENGQNRIGAGSVMVGYSYLLGKK